MKIIVTGQCTLHWGRMEFGNIGNYYIMEPFFEEIKKVFPHSYILTTFQMSDQFCNKFDVEILPMSFYYNWDDDLDKAKIELEIAYEFLKSGKQQNSTEYIDYLKETDLVIDFSGDIWGDNADFLGDNRFAVGLMKNRVAQIFAKKTVMLAGSPGPFNNKSLLPFAKEVFENFDLVTNREAISIHLLKETGFDISNTVNLACPAFLFKPAPLNKINDLPIIKNILNKKRESVAFLICGWNFEEGPFDKWPRRLQEYHIFFSAIESFLESRPNVDFYLMSHSNGFPIPPRDFKLNHGRDFPIMSQLYKSLENSKFFSQIKLLDGIYDSWQTKAILGNFDMVVSGRVHAAVAALSQNVPTVIIDYGHEPKAHKLKGFANVAGQDDCIAQPDESLDLVNKMDWVWENRNMIHLELNNKIPDVQKLALENFSLLKNIMK